MSRAFYVFVFLIIIIGAAPIVLITGLQLLGLPIELTWSTFFGALMVCMALQGYSS